ncbi:hypothetical protein FACS1894132_12990 [Clostridia bacterium]|nr:hypothetical protein FACS1894132_12990 [Clostridia bacterium]
MTEEKITNLVNYTLGMRIRYLRSVNNLSLQEFGELLGVVYETARLWEHDKYVPKIEMIFRIANLFDVPVNILTDGVEKFDFIHLAKE